MDLLCLGFRLECGKDKPMGWIAGQLTVSPAFAPAWLQLWLLIAICCWLLRMRRAAAALALLAFVPLLLPALAPLFGELKATLLDVVPWYILVVIGFFVVFIILRGVITLFLGHEIAHRTTSDLLTLTIAGLFGAALGFLRFLLATILRLFRQ